MEILVELADVTRRLSNTTGPLSIEDITDKLLSRGPNLPVDADIAILERTASVVRIPNTITTITSDMFKGWEGNLTDIYCDFAKGVVSGAPWGAPSTVVIHYTE